MDFIDEDKLQKALDEVVDRAMNRVSGLVTNEIKTILKETLTEAIMELNTVTTDRVNQISSILDGKLVDFTNVTNSLIDRFESLKIGIVK